MKTPTSKQILEDFKYLVTKLEEVHPNPFLNISKDELNKDLNNLALSSENIEEFTFYFELMKIFSKIKDSHTRVKGIGKILSEEKYPIRFKCLNNQYFISAINTKNQEYIGLRILSLNGILIKDVITKIAEVITHENEVVLSNAIEQWVYEPDFLKYLGIVDESLTLEIQAENKVIKLKPSKISEEKLSNPREDNIKNSETLNPKGIYWTKYFQDLCTYYLQYNECEDITQEEIHNIIEDIQDKKAKYVVVDLRNNIGGSSLILDPLTKFLYENQERYIPIVFLSNLTYSAAIINALNILDCKNSISIGTKTSGSPTKFGESTTLTLPNTNIDIVIPTKYFEEKGYAFGQPLTPKIEVKQTIEQYLNAVDVDWEEFLQQRLSLSNTIVS
jgi:C-terminal processing protease CtpA/Prc